MSMSTALKDQLNTSTHGSQKEREMQSKSTDFEEKPVWY